MRMQSQWTGLAMAGFAVLGLAGCQQRAVSEDPVFDVVRDNDVARVGQYLAEGGDPNRTNTRGETLLYVASGARGGTDVVRTLLLGGADLDLGNSVGRSPLHNASGWCNVETVLVLLDSGADATATDNDGDKPIDVVCVEPVDRRHAVISLLTEAGG